MQSVETDKSLKEEIVTRIKITNVILMRNVNPVAMNHCRICDSGLNKRTKLLK